MCAHVYIIGYSHVFTKTKLSWWNLISHPEPRTVLSENSTSCSKRKGRGVNFDKLWSQSPASRVNPDNQFDHGHESESGIIPFLSTEWNLDFYIKNKIHASTCVIRGHEASQIVPVYLFFVCSLQVCFQW